MYLRITERRNKDGSTVAYYALAENRWNADAKRAEARVVHNFGRADQVDRAALQRLVNSINRVLDEGDAVASGTHAIPDIEIDRVFELGVVLAARVLWEDLGIGAAIRQCATRAALTAPHEIALFAMAANRLEAPGSKLACAARWLPDDGCPMSPGCRTRLGSPSISSTARSTSSRPRPTRSSATSFCGPPTCSGSTST